jgi:hypothetical protein
VLSRAMGRDVQYSEIPLAVLRQQNAELAAMFEWFDRVGYDADIAALKRDFGDVPWQSFAQWADGVDWSALNKARPTAA